MPNIYAEQWQNGNLKKKKVLLLKMSSESKIGSTDIYTLPCVKQMAREKLLHSTGSSAWCSVMTERGWDGMGGVQEDRCIHIAKSRGCTAANCIAVYHNIIKQLYSKKKKRDLKKSRTQNSRTC